MIIYSTLNIDKIESIIKDSFIKETGYEVKLPLVYYSTGYCSLESTKGFVMKDSKSYVFTNIPIPPIFGYIKESFLLVFSEYTTTYNIKETILTTDNIIGYVPISPLISFWISPVVSENKKKGTLIYCPSSISYTYLQRSFLNKNKYYAEKSSSIDNIKSIKKVLENISK